MRQICIFVSKNKWITAFFAISLGIILTHITIGLPEFFESSKEWYNLFFQLSVGYIINFIFYITQVYIPDYNRGKTVRKCISRRIEKIIADMNATLSQLVAVYAEGHTGNVYTDQELDKLLNLRFSDNVNVLNASKTTKSNNVYFTVREWLLKCIWDTENDIDHLFRYYTSDITVDLMEILEAIPRSMYHSIMKTLLQSPDEIDFSTSKENFFVDYYQLMKALEKLKDDEYL